MVTLKIKILVLLEQTRSYWNEATGPAEQFIYNSFARHYKKSSLRQRLWEAACRGEIKKVFDGGQKYLQLTEKGRAVALSASPLLCYRRQWDGLWRFVTVAEWAKRRPFLQRQLARLGFGCWQSRLWLTPLDAIGEVKDLLEEGGWQDQTAVWESRWLTGIVGKDIAARAWSLDKLNQAYAHLISEWEEGQKNYKENLEVIKKLAAALQERYLTLICCDPGLPGELLPESWQGEKAQRLLVEWVKTIY